MVDRAMRLGAGMTTGRRAHRETGTALTREPSILTRILLMSLVVCCIAILIGFTGILGGCGEASDADSGSTPATDGGSRLVLEETGTIDTGDTKDPDHADLPYDAYEFEAEAGDMVIVAIEADGFTPLLKLVEVATGAPLAEWEAQYSDADALTSTIAGRGTYEARVYALEDGGTTGGDRTYVLTIETTR